MPNETEILRVLLEERSKGPFLSKSEARAQTARMIARKRKQLGLTVEHPTVERRDQLET